MLLPPGACTQARARPRASGSAGCHTAACGRAAEQLTRLLGGDGVLEIAGLPCPVTPGGAQGAAVFLDPHLSHAALPHLTREQATARIEALGTTRANESVTLTAKVTETVERVAQLLEADPSDIVLDKDRAALQTELAESQTRASLRRAACS